jgi:hypothetical protein
MANRERGEISLDVQGTAYTLRPTFNACCELETLTDTPVYEHINAALRGRLSAMRALMWCYLQECHGDEIKTLRDASAWIERAGGLAVVNAALERLQMVNAPEGEEGHANETNPPSAPNGTGETVKSRRGDSESPVRSSGPRRRVSSTAH